MIERLNQLSLYDFIELSCGDCSVLLSPDEDINEMELKKRSSDLIIEYKKQNIKFSERLRFKHGKVTRFSPNSIASREMSFQRISLPRLAVYIKTAQSLQKE